MKAWGSPSLIISDSMFTYLPEMRNTHLQAFRGLRSPWLINKLRNRVFSWYHYKNIILHVGTNDLFEISAGRYEKCVRDIVRELMICNPECSIILSSVLPRPCEFYSSEQYVMNFNNVLKHLASSLQNVKYMACEKSFYDKVRMPVRTLFSEDGLHLSTTGLNNIFSFVANTLAHL